MSVILLSVFSLQAAKADKPNVIMIMSDDQGWGDVGFNDNDAIIWNLGRTYWRYESG